MRSFRRGWAAACAAAYFVTNVAAAHAVEKSLWEERRVALRRTTWGARGAPFALLPLAGSLPVFDGGSTPSQPPSNFFKAAVPFDAASAALPYGTVSEMREGRRGAPVVFLVQDVHGNDGAQKNIGGLLGELSARGVTLTGVEGAWSPIDLGAFHRHPSPQAVSLVADALRAAGRLSGSEWAGLTALHPPTLVGVESPDLYHANVAAARDCVALRPTVETFLNNLSDALQNHKDRFYSPQLKSFDLHIKGYHEGREGLAVYSRYLSGLPGSGAQSGPQVKKFLKAMDWESRLNFEKVEADRRALMDRLSRDLGRKELDGLLTEAVAYRTGKQTNGDFLAYLKTLCVKTRIPLASYQSFADYIAYVGLVQSINRADLLSELTMWETGLAASLANSHEERRLVAMDRDASLLRQLLVNEMSPESWAQFNKRRNEVVALPSRLREFGDFQEPQEGMAAFFRSHEEFCRLAMARNGPLVSNLMSQINSRKASHAVLVAGGFHTPGLQSELLKRGCSTVVVTPRIEKVEGKPLDVFARDPLPFDHLFAGKPISLPAELLFNDGRRAHFLGGQVSSEALAIAPAGDWDRDLKKWLEDQGFTVTKVTRSTEGLVRLEVVLRGIPLVLLSGPKGLVESAKIPRGSKQEKTILSNGHCVLTYVDSPSAVQIFWDLIRHFARSIGTIVVKGITMLVPSGQGTSPVETTWLGTLFSVLLPAKWLSEIRVVPVGPSSGEISDSGSRTIDFVREGTSDYYKIMANSDQVGRINYVETNQGILLVSVKVDKKKNGYGSSAILKLALRAARISNLAPQDVPFPFIVSEVENPWLFQYLKRTIFENGTMELSPVPLGASFRADTIRNNWFDEKNLNFESLSGNGNIDPNSRNYVSSFHVRGILRKELKTDREEGRETPENHQFHISRLGLAVRVSLSNLPGKEVASAMVGGKRGAIEIQNISIEPGESTCAYDLIAGAVKEFLLLKGQGRVLLRGVKDPRIKQAAKEVFGNKLIMARKGFGRSLTNGPWKDAIDPSSEEFHRLLEDPTALVDLSGTLTPEARKALWPNEDLPYLVKGAAEPLAPNVVFIPSTDDALQKELSEYSARERNLYDIWISNQRVGTIVFSETSQKLILKNIDLDVGFQGQGNGKIVFRALAKRATHILTPELNSEGDPVPFEGRGIINPSAFSIRKGIYKSGTMEAVALGTKYTADLGGPVFSWDNALKEGTPAFDQLTGSANVGENGEYIQLFHLRGEIPQDINDEAARETLREQWVADKEMFSRGATPLNSFALLGGGFPFDPILGLTVAAIFLVAMFFKGEILNWLKGRVPPGVYVFANSAIPDLSSFRPRIVRVFTQVLGFLIEQIVEIVGRLFGMAELQVPVALGIIPQDGKTTEFISRGPSSRLDDIVKAMDSSDIQGIYEHLAHYFGLWGVAADVGSSSYDLPAKGLLAGGMKKVSLVDHLHHEQKTISPGIDVFPGDATNLSNQFGEKTLDAIVFHRSLHHIVADKESRGSGAGQLLIEAGSSPDDIFFHIDLLSRVMDETFKTLKPGGRVLLYFDAHTFRFAGSPGLFGWSLEDMLAEKGFEDVSLITSKNGTVVATGVRPNLSLGHTFFGGIGVSRLSVNDTLDEADREVFSKALGAISPTVFDMQGVDVLIDPRRVALERNLVEELKNKMGVNGGVVGEMGPEKVEGIIKQDPASIHWVRGFSSKPNGVNSLAETCVESARKGDPNASGAALAAWDDSKLLAGPNPEIVANLLAVLIGDKKDQAVGLADQFAEAYNRVRAGLLLPKLLSGTLMKPSTSSELQSGIVLNISALFDQQAEDTAKNNTWLALAAALSARERNPNVPLGLVVHGVNVNEQIVTETLSRSVPRWANFMTDGVLLFVQGDRTGKAVFVNEKFSLNALRTNPLWNRPLTVLGLSAEAIAEAVDQLESIQLIPLDEFVNKQLKEVLRRLRFILRNA